MERSGQRAANASSREAMDDDLNTAEALAAVFEYIRETNSAMDAGVFTAGNVAGATRFAAADSIRCSTC